MNRSAYPFILLLLLSFTFIGCSSDDNPVAPTPTPIARFTMTGSRVAPTTISFNSTSVNAVNHEWDFGDDRTSILDDPEMTFDDPGIYVVTLVVHNADLTKSDSETQTLTITPPDPVAEFDMSGATIAPTIITFTNRSTNASSYQWDFGDGRTSIQENPRLAFNTYGEFTITLVATFGATSRSDTARKQLTITPSRVFLDSVIVELIPFTDENGIGWDAGNGPDFQWDLYDSVDTRITYSTIFENSSPANFPLRYPIVPSIELTNFYEPLWLNFWDYDPDGWDFMDLMGLWFRYEIPQFGYVSSYTLTSVDDRSRVRIVVHWQ